jgi:hypothetical protein
MSTMFSRGISTTIMWVESSDAVERMRIDDVPELIQTD